MNIPNLPPHQMVLKPDGNVDPKALQNHLQNLYSYLTQLTTQLQNNVSNQGNFTPQQNTATIASLNTPESTSALLYNNETHQLMVNLNGTFKQITTS